MNRKSIARRRPVIVYRLEPSSSDAEAVDMRAWVVDDEETGRLDPKSKVGEWTFTGWTGDPVRAWLDNRDTDGIHALPEPFQRAIWSADDAIRSSFGI